MSQKSIDGTDRKTFEWAVGDKGSERFLDLDFKDTPEGKCIISSQKPYIGELFQRLRFDDAKLVKKLPPIDTIEFIKKWRSTFSAQPHRWPYILYLLQI